MNPRPGDLPTANGPAEPARPGPQSAYPSNYSAPSPADRPTAMPTTGQPTTGSTPTMNQNPQGAGVHQGNQAWSQDTRDTGPVRTPAPGDQAWWEPRPSGAWSAPGWGAPTAGRTGAPGATGSNGTQAFPGAPSTGSIPTGLGAPGYPRNTYTGPAGRTAVAEPPAATPRRKTPVLIASAVALALVAGFGGGVIGSQLTSSSANSSDSSLSQLNTSAPVSDRTPAPAGSVQEVAAKVLPSTVSILASSQNGSGEGSGVILTDDGMILTNNHVVAGATELQVRFNDGTTASATVVGTDSTDDLAVIKADGVSGLTPATLGNSADLQVGQPVVAIGSPLGLSATVTSGIVSALNRPVRTAAEETASGQGQATVMNAVQTDAAINPGNSGGALVDMNGAVIGINSAIASLSESSDGSQAGSIGVGFAIPVDQAKRIAQEIINTGQATHAVLGASVGDAADANSQIPTGAQVAEVVAGSGAEAAGLEKGDVITKIGDLNVESADALIAAVRAATPNGSTSITYTRNGQSETVDVTLGSATAN